MKKNGLCLFQLIALFSLLVVISTSAHAQAYVKSNGVVTLRLNDYNNPMITGMWVGGTQVMPHDNTGADFQMTGRSWQGNGYNPTQGGDCLGNPSILTGIIPNWSGVGGIAPNNGILLGIAPRNFNANPGCAGVGPVLPFNFNFGVTLGDGGQLYRETTVIDMSIIRQPGSQEIVKSLSETPVAFPYNHIMRFAYFSPDGYTFYPLYQCGTPVGCTHDTAYWTTNELDPRINENVNGQAIALFNIPNAVENPNAGLGMAFYSHVPTGMNISHRNSGRNNLTLIGMVGDLHGSGATITDYNWHTLRRIMVVGNVNTMRAAIGQARSRITSWGNW